MVIDDRSNSTRTEMDAVESNPRKYGICHETAIHEKNCPLTRQH